MAKMKHPPKLPAIQYINTLQLWQRQVELVLDSQLESLALRENMADVREKLISCQHEIDNLHSGTKDAIGLKGDLEKTNAEMGTLKTLVEEVQY